MQTGEIKWNEFKPQLMNEMRRKIWKELNDDEIIADMTIN